MFTTDLEDAYYSMCLTEESRNLFGASLRMDKPSLEKLTAAGVLPEFQSTEEGDVFIRPRGLPMGFRNSCAIWTALAMTLTKRWRSEGIMVLHYIDDFTF